MPYDYDSIVRDWFEKLKLPFQNHIHKSFHLSYDEIMDLYTDVWMELRQIIIEDRATDNKWKALIFTIGRRKAQKIVERRPFHVSIDADRDGDDDKFNRAEFELDKIIMQLESPSVYKDPELQAVLGAELSYIPDPCNTILKMYYFDEMSMKDIALAMNYSTSRSAITTKSRCMEKLTTRVKNAVRRLGIIS